MGACVVICRTAKPKARKGRILFINAVNEVTRERAQSFLTDNHIERIVAAYREFEDNPSFTRVATREAILAKDGNLSIPLYVDPTRENGTQSETETDSLEQALNEWIQSRTEVAKALTQVLPTTGAAKFEARPRGINTCELFKQKAWWSRIRFGDVVENLNETVTRSLLVSIGS